MQKRSRLISYSLVQEDKPAVLNSFLLPCTESANSIW
nr:MAG TPA: hypothetical protein [Caudoviricetes sp.]